MLAFSGESLAKWSEGEWRPSPPAGLASGISTDTRSLLPGNVYVAIEGKNFDGHNFVEEAFSKGAIGSVVRRGSQSCSDEAGRQLYVRDTLTALRDFAAGYRKEVAPRITAVTGSVGKTTVKEMLAGMLGTAMPTASSKGNWNNHIGVPLSLLAMESTAQAGVFEVAMSNPGEISQLCELLEPACGVVTNVGAAHLESFGSVEEIVDEKCELLRCLPTSGVGVVCVDSEHYDKMRSAASGRIVTVSMVGKADYSLIDGPDGDGISRILEESSGDRIEIRLSVPGEHNICNAMMAIAVAREHGVGWDGVQAALAEYSPLQMRWTKEMIGGVVLINDAYNANPLSMRAAVKTFAAMPSEGKKWLVLGDMLELGGAAADEHSKIGRLIAHGDWAGLLVVGEMSRHIAGGAEKEGLEADRIMRCAGCKEAARLLFDLAREGDAVMLKASRGMGLETVADEYAELAGAERG